MDCASFRGRLFSRNRKETTAGNPFRHRQIPFPKGYRPALDLSAFPVSIVKTGQACWRSGRDFYGSYAAAVASLYGRIEYLFEAGIEGGFCRR